MYSLYLKWNHIGTTISNAVIIKYAYTLKFRSMYFNKEYSINEIHVHELITKLTIRENWIFTSSTYIRVSKLASANMRNWSVQLIVSCRRVYKCNRWRYQFFDLTLVFGFESFTTRFQFKYTCNICRHVELKRVGKNVI